jgi:hypothetical protein
MNRRVFSLLLVIVFVGIFASSPSQSAYGATVYTKDNGVIRIKLNESNYPMITSMFINGGLVIPNNNAGADFQMTGRSSRGDAYNPTQGGDCRGNPSRLSGVIPDWGDGPGDISPSNGILLGIDPRNYNATSSGCNTGSILPYNFNFGVTLGDDIYLPKQVMVLDLTIVRESGSEEIIKAASEMPVAFPYTSIMRYAYWSPDGLNFQRLQNCNTPIGCTHDTLQWPSANSASVNVNIDGKAVALSSAANAIEDEGAGVGMAFYSHVTTGLIVSHRKGAGRVDLTLISTVGERHGSTNRISDFGLRTLRRIMVVGNLGTMKAAIGIAQNRITDWGNWY